MKKILSRALLFLMSFGMLLSAGCASGTELTLEQEARRDRRHYPDIVRTFPEGFISLDAATEGMDEILNVLFWSTNFVVQDSEGVTIFQTDVKDREFIVINRNAFHVNESMFNEIARFVTDIYEQLNRVYNIGDVMQMRGQGGIRTDDGPFGRSWSIYNIKISGVENKAINESVVYYISFSINPNVSEELILGFFDYVETQNGNTYSDFVLVNSEMVYIELGSNEAIDMLVLNISQRELQESVIQNSMRRVRVGIITT